ncbi:hypothetical protein K437DRAFT_82467 [Tilletiaria anomala UBC 951]|uniref:Zn(2)-C6 fungal-type domain-containing protein n=1 Tax=Tilletiaria anomala (strain ATCC 24038 / CBS 436.72 / UBC 951) TaxID=1037660 RepID=A0A066W3F4_TILAU|nr:uncharacterized protein K437DRAFT_82467 [Tilletiaria anomala UBC 951]KDN48487.1 hypothetical protein K437DRAFT_82467 [Tilletiaria anomala UBC 951]
MEVSFLQASSNAAPCYGGAQSFGAPSKMPTRHYSNPHGQAHGSIAALRLPPIRETLDTALPYSQQLPAMSPHASAQRSDPAYHLPSVNRIAAPSFSMGPLAPTFAVPRDPHARTETTRDSHRSHRTVTLPELSPSLSNRSGSSSSSGGGHWREDGSASSSERCQYAFSHGAQEPYPRAQASYGAQNRHLPPPHPPVSFGVRGTFGGGKMLHAHAHPSPPSPGLLRAPKRGRDMRYTDAPYARSPPPPASASASTPASRVSYSSRQDYVAYPHHTKGEARSLNAPCDDHAPGTTSEGPSQPAPSGTAQSGSDAVVTSDARTSTIAALAAATSASLPNISAVPAKLKDSVELQRTLRPRLDSREGVPACNECRRRKVKCDRRSPCGRCVASKRTCETSDMLMRRGPLTRQQKEVFASSGITYESHRDRMRKKRLLSNLAWGAAAELSAEHQHPHHHLMQQGGHLLHTQGYEVAPRAAATPFRWSESYASAANELPTQRKASSWPETLVTLPPAPTHANGAGEWYHASEYDPAMCSPPNRRLTSPQSHSIANLSPAAPSRLAPLSHFCGSKADGESDQHPRLYVQSPSDNNDNVQQQQQRSADQKSPLLSPAPHNPLCAAYWHGHSFMHAHRQAREYGSYKVQAPHGSRDSRTLPSPAGPRRRPHIEPTRTADARRSPHRLPDTRPFGDDNMGRPLPPPAIPPRAGSV